MDPSVALENVAYARAHNSEHQLELLKMAAAIMYLSWDMIAPKNGRGNHVPGQVRSYRS